MGVTLGGDASKSGKNTNLLLIMGMRWEDIQTVFTKTLMWSISIPLYFSYLHAIYYESIYNVPKLCSAPSGK